MATRTKRKPDPTPQPEPLANSNEVAVKFEVRGAGKKLWFNRDPFVCLVGPAGTGKTRIWCERIHALCTQYPGIRVLMTRLYRSSMTHSCMKTFSDEVLNAASDRRAGVRDLEGVRWKTVDQEWLYPERYSEHLRKMVSSEVVVGGLDDPEKIMSTQYDIIYINEWTDTNREQFDMLKSRNRNGVLHFNQIGGDCNPRGPKHYLKQAIDSGEITGIASTFKDNPKFWDNKLGDYTPEGREYIEVKLGSLKGVWRARLLEGRWVAAEGVIYESFDRATHVLKPHQLPPTWENGIPPRSWPRIWVIDWGFRNPLVWGNIAISPEGRMYLFQEIYMTKLNVQDAAELIMQNTVGQPYPEAIICDHDAGARATFEQSTGLLTLPAYKEVASGIQAVQKRLELQYDGTNMVGPTDMGMPGIVFLENTLIHPPDPDLLARSLPTRTIDEIEDYRWDDKASMEKQRGDIPIKLNDHGCDMIRYGAAYVDNLAVELSEEYTDNLIALADTYEPRITLF